MVNWENGELVNWYNCKVFYEFNRFNRFNQFNQFTDLTII